MRKLTKTAAVVASMAVMAMGATVMTSAATEGWVQSGSTWYYYVKGDKVSNQWVLAGEDWYFLDDEGRMVKDSFVRTDKYSNESEVLDDNDIHSDLGRDDIDDDAEFYYLGSDGKMVKGWKSFKASNIYASPNSNKASNVWYYFGATGRMYVNEWVESNGQWYALSSNGIMYAEATVNNDLVEWDDDKSFYMDKNGAWVKGWYQTTKDNGAGLAPDTADNDDDKQENVFFNDKKWVYGDPDDGVLADKEWLEINGKYYFFGQAANTDSNKDSNLELKFVQREDNGKNVELDTFIKAKLPTVTGASVTATAETIVLPEDANAIQSVAMLSDKFVQWRNHDKDIEYFYLTDNGAALTGWKEFEDDYYICGNSKGELYYDEVALINGKYYYFDQVGVCDYKGLNNGYDYVAVVDPTDDKDYDGDKHLTLTKGAYTDSEVTIYSTSSRSNVSAKKPEGVKDLVKETISDMRKDLIADGSTDRTTKYEINGRDVAVRSMTDAEVVLVYTATQSKGSANSDGEVDVDLYKLRTSSKISATVSVEPTEK